ncbi:MAG: tripartite tricarboxylate transporter substrate binding protein [Pseudomonadota bacterium]|nr:tripartite tricarboxylate transporter substrate binding protein [Pseudomonadota bacterium]
MKSLPVHGVLNAWLVGLLGLLSAGSVLAQAYPTHAIKLVVPYPPGGSADILARLVQQGLTGALGQSVIVENKPGAGTAIGAEAVARAAPDGYTLLLGTVSSHAMNPALVRVNFDPIKDFAAIAPLATIPFVLDVHPSVPARTVQEFVAYSKLHPDDVNYSSAGNGTSNHLAGALFNQTTGTKLVHVPYKGSAPALQDLVAGRVQAMFDLVTTSLPMIESGKVRAIAVTSAARLPTLPQVPTIREAGYPDYEVTAWFGLYAPAGTPLPILARLHDEAVKALAAPEMREKLVKLGMEPMASSREAFAKLTADELTKWTALVKSANIKAD